ncbi:Hypothetical protein GLP15_3131 [Giardia lamblia P15]|uniref:ERCC4 domain-containing protein n=1 Tax=Giardia intestinalis (strain P15) TaxID=658858 RepID=E1EVQ7_GIAIA|nr:Hypothetical protein GLP15_3131 [Giardia lamblia P15]
MLPVTLASFFISYMKPSVFVTLISEQLHYQLSSALRDYLHSIDTVYRRTGSFLETESKHSTTALNLNTAELEFIRFSEKEYHAREEMLAEPRNKRTRIRIGDIYWTTLVSIRDGSIGTRTLSQTPSVKMKTSSSQIQLDMVLSRLLELKYVMLSEKGEPILTKKGMGILAKLSPQHHKMEKTTEDEESILDDPHQIGSTNQTAIDCRLGIILDCRGEGSYAKLLPQDVAQCTSIAKLPRGDCLILNNDRPVALVERKTISDLSASFYDGRIQRQLSPSAGFPTFLLVEDPQLLLIHEDQLFQAVLNEVRKENVSSIIQSVSAKHTARIYEYLFRSASNLSRCQHVPPSDNAESNPLSTMCPDDRNDWHCFISNILCNYSSSVAEAVVSAYPTYNSLAMESPSTTQQRLLTMGIPRNASYCVIESLFY